jgi:hypothetical protein
VDYVQVLDINGDLGDTAWALWRLEEQMEEIGRDLCPLKYDSRIASSRVIDPLTAAI